MPTPSHRRARRQGVLLGSALSSRRNRKATVSDQKSSVQPVAQPTKDIKQQLTDLKSLLDANLITQADFDAKKKQVLGL